MAVTLGTLGAGSFALMLASYVGRGGRRVAVDAFFASARRAVTYS